MSPACLALVRAANRELSRFLDDAALALDDSEKTHPSEIQSRVSALLTIIAGVRGSLGGPAQHEDLDAESVAEMKLYGTQLERLKHFLSDLQRFAEARRGQLGADARQAADALAWSKALELTDWEPPDLRGSRRRP
ncbi:MAG: hypothetical protein ACRD3D_04975 [Terriglobia bacterium]